MPTTVQINPKWRFSGQITATRRAFVLHGSPWIFMHFHGHQMITQIWPKRPQGLLEVTQKLLFFQ